MKFHSYLALAFSFLASAIRQQAVQDAARQMAEDAAAKRYALCTEQLERDGWYGCCSCSGHRAVDLGDGDMVWK